MALSIAAQFGRSLATLIISLYGAMRVLDILVYQVWLILFAPYNPSSLSDFALRGYRRIVILVLHNYLEIVLWFATIYTTYRDLFGASGRALSSAVGAFYYSMVTMSTVGYGEITPATDSARIIVAIHLIVGVFMSVVILARFVSYLPTPRSMDAAEHAQVLRP